VTNQKNGQILQNGQMRFFMPAQFKIGHEMAYLATLLCRARLTIWQTGQMPRALHVQGPHA